MDKKSLFYVSMFIVIALASIIIAFNTGCRTTPEVPQTTSSTPAKQLQACLDYITTPEMIECARDARCPYHLDIKDQGATIILQLQEIRRSNQFDSLDIIEWKRTGKIPEPLLHSSLD